jgi:hypothetical protein
MMMAQGGAPPMGGEAPDPSQLGVQGAAQPVDPATAAMGAAPMDPSQDPTGAAAAAAPPAAAPAPMPPATPQGAPGQQKLKPEQMMQMLDYRLYNMQQQLTAIMNAMGVQVAPESLVLPPGTTGAPPAESAMPGGPMAPPPAAPPGQAPGGAAPPADPAMAMGGDPTAKAANWWDTISHHAASIGRPVDPRITAPADEQSDLQTKASAAAALCRSLINNSD